MEREAEALAEGEGVTKRRVMAYEWRWDGKEYAMVEDGEGRFVQYGTEFVATDFGLEQVETAGVVFSDGSVRNYPPHMIRFLDVEEEEK